MRTKVERTESQSIQIPKGMSLAQVANAIKMEQDFETYEEREILVQETIRRFPYDAAIALRLAIDELHGGSLQYDKPVPGGIIEARLITIPASTTEYIQVPWGPFKLPDIEGELETQMTEEGDAPCLLLLAKVKRKYEKAIRLLAERTRVICDKFSIYVGQAISIRVVDDPRHGKKIAPPNFLDVASSLDPIFSKKTMAEIERSILIPLRDRERAKAIGVPLKRGALLSGTYGSGKTLTANMIARVGTEAGWTFIYASRAREYVDALMLAQDYQPAIVFVDDIDRITEGLRTHEMDELLLRIDGIDTKDTDIFTIAATNNLNLIHPAFLRPGRTDVIIQVDVLDEGAAERLIRRFAQPVLPQDADLGTMPAQYSKLTAAHIREIVDRSKLELLRTTAQGKSLVLEPSLMRKMHDEVAEERSDVDSKSTEKDIRNRLNGERGLYA